MTYCYRCPAGHEITESLSLSMRPVAQTKCPTCGLYAQRDYEAEAVGVNTANPRKAR